MSIKWIWLNLTLWFIFVFPLFAQEKETIVELSDNVPMEFVWIEPGIFYMGSPEMGPNRQSNLNATERPQHQVPIGEGFWLGKYEITQKQWEAVMDTRPWAGKDGVHEHPNHPAVYISWDDVHQFIRKLNQLEGTEVYRLPTEAEWEYACRAETTTWWALPGDDESQLGEYAWYYRGKIDNNTWDMILEHAQLVGQKQPNKWDLYDMLGNVKEWCQDGWKTSYSKDHQSEPFGLERVVRGGSYSQTAQFVRPAFRSRLMPSMRFADLGARLVQIEPKKDTPVTPEN